MKKPEMNISEKSTMFVLLFILIRYVSGLEAPTPANVEVDILDGEATVLWQHPVDAPPNSKYNVELAEHLGEYALVVGCTGITINFCNLSDLITEYRKLYRVRVRLVAGKEVSPWVLKRFLPNESKLQPPSFTLRATSSSLTIRVHQKPVLKKLFPFGLIYTLLLEERGDNNKNTTAYLIDDMGQNEKTFSSLHWGTEYCVSVKVEGEGAPSTSPMSEPQCLLLPEQEWYLIAVSSLSTLGVLALAAIVGCIILFYLKSPEKTPAALKSPASGWLPLSVGEGTMEVVTDKGWFLSSSRPEVKHITNEQLTHVTITEDDGEEDRRTSMDSGVSLESNSAADSSGAPPRRQEDSGCGSMGGPESSSSSQTGYPLQEETGEVNTGGKMEDSGLGLGCQLDSSSINLDTQDCGSLKESVSGGSYCRQNPSIVQVQVCDEEEALKQIYPDSVLAEVVTGYRAGPQSCICSGAGQCTWCHKRGLYGQEVIRQYRSTCIENKLLGGKCDFVDSYKRALAFSNYSKTSPMETVVINDLDTTFLQLGESFPLLTALSPPPLVEGGRDINMNNVALSLCDVELRSD